MKIIFKNVSPWRLLIVLGQLVSIASIGQTTTLRWQQIFESASTNTSSILICASAPAPDGGVVSVVNVDQVKGLPTATSMNNGSMLVKLSSQGLVQWNSSLKEVTVTNVLFPTSLKARNIETAVGGGYFVYGTYSGFGGVTGLFLLKINEEGQTIWFKDLFQLPAGQVGVFGFEPGSILALKDGGCLAVNTFYGPRSSNYVSVYKADASGNILFSSSIDAGESSILRSNNSINGVCEHDGGYALVGSFYTSSPQWPVKGWVAKLDQAGQQVWLQVVDNTVYSDIIPTASGDGYIAVSNDYTIPLYKLSLDGTIVTSNAAFTNGSPGTVKNLQLTTDRDGNYLVSGTAAGNNNNTDFAIWKARFDGSQFVPIWNKVIDKGMDALNSFNIAADGSYIASGTILSIPGYSDASVPETQAGYIVAFTVSTPPPPATTNITLSPSYDCTTGQLTVNATGGNGSAIEYQIIGLRGWGASPSFMVPAYQRTGTSFTLQARQQDQMVSLPFTTTCGITPPPPPTDPGTVPSGQFVLRTPDYDCNTGRLTAVYSNGDASIVEYQIAGLRGWGQSPEFMVPAWQRTGTSFTIEARTANGKTATIAYTTACGPTPPTTGSGLGFATPTMDCGGSNEPSWLHINLLNIDLNYRNTIQYRVPGSADWQPHNVFYIPYWQANGTTFTLYARQNNIEYTTTFTTNCGGAARQASSGEEPLWQARVLPNPVVDRFKVEITGAQGQLVIFQLTDLGGKSISEQQTVVKADQHQETLTLPRQAVGVYLLRVSTQKHSQTLRVLKQ